MRVQIKNTKVFTVDSDCKYHWAKLPKLTKFMRTKYLIFNSGANLQGANLQDADLRGANLHCADLRGAFLHGASLHGALLHGAYLHGADLRDVDLRDAFLHGADLQHAYLQGADLRGAYLQYANLQGTYLRGAYLQGADNEKVKIVDFMSVSGIGSAERQTLFFKTNKDVIVQCGCFYGTLKEFQKKVKETHKGNKHEKEYLTAIKLVKIKFEL